MNDEYRIKFERLQPWISKVFQGIKKDLLAEHLLKTPSFIKKHFPKRALDKLTNEEFAAAYVKEVVEGDEDLGENIIARWVMKNGELYQYFATELSKINPKFDEIENISEEVASTLLNTSIEQFGATKTYIFCVMNAVVIPDVEMLKLRELALSQVERVKSEEDKNLFQTVEQASAHYEKEIRKLTEKYEKRVQGVERKYAQDVEGLKKQISQLHKKLSLGAKAVGV
jgi:hypothetical protein